MTGGISAARQPPTHWICLSLPGPGTRKACSPLPPASVNLISQMMSLSCLWGQGLGDGQGDEFISPGPVTPTPITSCRAALPLFKFSELRCSGRAGGRGGV